MACDPLFDRIFCEEFESGLGLVETGHFTGQNDVKPVFSQSKIENSQKIDESWHVTPCSIAFFVRISNLCLVWTKSVILPVKLTSNRVLPVRFGNFNINDKKESEFILN